ncbi:MAG: ABC transporter permease [Rhodocyclaceae bacterium]|jgi:peptide/nickel transport system permease protein|nr:ABC transporter permease [Rhodocyclaceae bacterium]
MSTQAHSAGLWTLAWRRLLGDRVALVSMSVVALFIGLMLASSLDIVAADWNDEIAVGYARPSLFSATAVTEQAPEPEAVSAVIPQVGAGDTAIADPAAVLKQLGLDDIKITDPLAKELDQILATTPAPEIKPREETRPFGADKWGHDVLLKVIKGSETSIFVGLAAALVATVIGTLLGAVAGYYGGWLDDLLNWFYSIFTAIPYLLLILAIAAVLDQKGMTTIVLILGLTGWTGIFRLVRAEYMKHRTREYVQAADAIGASNFSRMFRHIFPNVSHVSLVQLSVHTVGFIKSEVILSFLGFGVPVDKVSWGSMLGEAQNELILGYWWQLVAATLAMAVLVTAFSMFTDALRDALDPKIK